MRGQIRATGDLGYAVKSVRRSRGLSQQQLADALGVTQRYVSELERGRPKVLDDGYLRTLGKMGIRLEFEIDG
jgi:HTH-type transcriptional regulator/antitoxin HipB